LEENSPGVRPLTSGFGQVKHRLASTGLPLGCLADCRLDPCQETFLDAGDLLVLVSDGFAEAESPEGEWFGEEDVLETARRNSSQPAAAVTDALCRRLREFCRCDPSDDVSATVVKVLAAR
jgi:serine phosphatase RsbU (regulator of sigma subunit)